MEVSAGEPGQEISAGNPGHIGQLREGGEAAPELMPSYLQTVRFHESFPVFVSPPKADWGKRRFP